MNIAINRHILQKKFFLFDFKQIDNYYDINDKKDNDNSYNASVIRMIDSKIWLNNN